MNPSPTPPPSAAAVVVAAGSATRMGSAAVRKPLLELAGRPMLEHACTALDAARLVAEIIVVAHPGDVETIERWCCDRAAFDKVRGVVTGGAERAESVARGVRWCSFGVDVIAVHDAARPLVRPEAVDATIARAAETGAALLAVPVRDTLKQAAEGGTSVTGTLDRSSLWAAQTPQCFAARAFREVLERAAADAFAPTDDAALWERYRGPVAVVEGDPSNIKITTPKDMELAAAWLEARAAKEETPG